MMVRSTTHTSARVHPLIVFLPQDSSCSICMNTFRASLAEEEMARAMDSPAQPAEGLGVTRLTDTCGHIFCRKEYSYPSYYLKTYG